MILKILFSFQNLINKGNLTIEVSNFLYIKVEKEKVEINIKDIERVKNLLKIFSKRKKEKSIFNSFKSLIKKLNDIGEQFKRENKKLILKVEGKEILILGESSLLFKNFKIKNKLYLIKLFL
ncbi:hypothetical protein [Methanocaldococcus infernus]